MHPGVNGKKFPDKPAVIMAGSEKVITHGELNELSNQGAHLFRSLGLKPGDSIAIMLENHFLFFPIIFAAWRSGLRYTTISWRLQPSEVEYIVKDCEAKILINSGQIRVNGEIEKRRGRKLVKGDKVMFLKSELIFE